MAIAVEFRQYTPADSRTDLLRRLENAPAQHAEALLAAYDVLEKLHEKDVLSTLNGLLAARDTVIDHVSDLVSSEEAVNLIRLALIGTNLLKTINPDDLNGVLKSGADEPPSLFQIARRMFSKDARRAMGTFASLLNVFGSALSRHSAKS